MSREFNALELLLMQQSTARLQCVRDLEGQLEEQKALYLGERHLVGLIAHELGVKLEAGTEGPTLIGAIEALQAVFHAADQLVAHIRCHGEINSKHPLVLDLLEALNAKDPK